MPEILPFRAIHYPWGSDLSRLIAPPYDVISPAERDALRDSDETNVIHITLGGEHSNGDDRRYRDAALRFRDWLASGVLLQDPDALFFLYGMTYESHGQTRTTLGLLAALTLEHFGSGQIYPHERTIPGPIQDRLKLMRETEANLEPLWFFASSGIEGFRGLAESTFAQDPVASVVDVSGVRHSLWPVAPAQAAETVRSLSRTPLVIADGHHRYETALAYRDERRRAAGAGPWDQTLALVVDPVDYPPLLEPIHRLALDISPGLISELVGQALEEQAGPGRPPPGGYRAETWLEKTNGDGEGRQEVDETSGRGKEREKTGGGYSDESVAQSVSALHNVPESISVPLERVSGSVKNLVRMVQSAGPGTIGLVTGAGAWLLRASSELDTVFLNDHVLGPSGATVTYEHDPDQVEKAVQQGAAAFILAPAPIELVAQKALSGERMPPKTTLFWPKPRTGFVMRDLRRD